MFLRSTKRQMRMDERRAMAQTIIRRPIAPETGVQCETILNGIFFSMWFLKTFNSLHRNKKTKIRKPRTKYKITYTLIATQNLMRLWRLYFLSIFTKWNLRGKKRHKYRFFSEYFPFSLVSIIKQIILIHSFIHSFITDTIYFYQPTASVKTSQNTRKRWAQHGTFVGGENA